MQPPRPLFHTLSAHPFDPCLPDMDVGILRLAGLSFVPGDDVYTSIVRIGVEIVERHRVLAALNAETIYSTVDTTALLLCRHHDSDACVGCFSYPCVRSLHSFIWSQFKFKNTCPVWDSLIHLDVGS